MPPISSRRPASLHRSLRLTLAALAVAGGLAPAARAEGEFATPLLADLIWQRNPDVRMAALAEGTAAADLTRNLQLPNPQLDAGQISLPMGVGPMPQGTSLFVAPAQFVGVTQPVDLARRPLRQDRARLGVDQARWQTIAMHKQRTADLLGVSVRLAVAQLRLRLLQDQTDVVREQVRLTALTAKEGFVAPLDLEKLLLEQGRLQTLLDGARLSVSQARTDWTSLTLESPPTLDEAAARRLIAALAELPKAWPNVDEMLQQVPQRQVLILQGRQAGADLAIARRMWVPDVGVRLGYTYDTLPGNIPHSLGWSVSGPIPVFQAGQAEAQEAESRQAAARMALDALDRTTRLTETALRSRAILVHHTLEALDKERLPAARATLARLQTALKARGIPLTDLIQVRRTYLDLEGVRVDLLEQLSKTLVDYRQLLGWQLPDPPVPRPSLPRSEEP